jgi:transposase-like protein
MPKLKMNGPQTPALDVNPEVLDELVKGPTTPEQLETMFQNLKKAIVERALGAELTQHLGYARAKEVPSDQPNHRNGTSPKAAQT